MTTRIRAEDLKQVSTVIDGRRYDARRGYFEMPDRDARMHAQSANLPMPSAALPVGRRSGFRCECGFGTFFTTCSRCGGSCEREN